MFKKTLLILCIIINLIILSDCSIISVGNNGSFENITSAIEASNPEDIINIHSGNYNEKVDINKPNLALHGIGETRPIIQQTVSILADGTTFEGFNVKATLKINSKNNRLSNNSFSRLSLGMIPVSSKLYEVVSWPLRDPFIYQGMPRIGEIEERLNPKNFVVMNNHIDLSNYVGGGRVYFLNNVSNKVINKSSNAGYIYCFNCINISISGLDDGQYIYFINTTNSSVDNNDLRGLSLQNSSNNLINYNRFTQLSNYGIDLLYSDNNLIIGNYMNSSFGIRLSLSTNNLLKDNSIIGSRGNDEGDLQNGIALAFPMIISCWKILYQIIAQWELY